MKFRFTKWIAVVGLVALVGCGDSSTTTPQVDGSKFLLSQEPAGAKGVGEVRESVKDQDEIAVIGRIGGMADPWIEDMAAFSIVDPALKSCSDMDDDHCPKPWDYCCEPLENLASSTAFVRIVDEDGKPVEASAKELLGVKELSTVVVKGTAKLNAAGDLTILATGIHVRK